MPIWKYDLEPFGNIISMPKFAKVLSTAYQGQDLKIWAAVDPSAPTENRKFLVCGTGWPGNPTGEFVGTAFHPSGLVFHVFDNGVAS